MHSHRNPQREQKLKTYARELRGQQSDVESRLWNVLRDRRFFGHKFRRQHPVENFILDFYCPDQHLAIELDGGQHAEQEGYDQRRDATLTKLGIRILRFWNHDLLQQAEAVLQVIFDALGQAPAAPHPQPLSPQAGRGGQNHPSPHFMGRGAGGAGRLSPSPPLGGEGRGEEDFKRTGERQGEGPHFTPRPACGERGRGEGKSLRDRALAYLARRDHTRLELTRKLLQAGYVADDIESLLNELSQRGWLSNTRFAESYVQHKQQRFGTLKLAHELRSRGVDESDIQQALASAKETELEHAREVWAKRFGAPPASAQEKARQMRFLQGRGFAPETIRRVLNATDAEPD